jgi:hypothetical protein
VQRKVTEPKPHSRIASPATEVKPLTRRNFIVWALAGLLGAIVAAITAPLLVYLYPAKSAGTTVAPVRIPLATPLDAIPEGGGFSSMRLRRRRW